MYMHEGRIYIGLRRECFAHAVSQLNYVSNDIHVCPRTGGGLIVSLIAIPKAREFT